MKLDWLGRPLPRRLCAEATPCGAIANYTQLTKGPAGKSQLDFCLVFLSVNYFVDIYFFFPLGL